MIFEDFIKMGKARRAKEDKPMLKSILDKFREDMFYMKTLELNELSRRKLSTNYYDCLRALLEAVALKEGFKIYEHEAFSYFLDETGHKIEAIKFDRFRKIRNGLSYYGKDISLEEAREMILDIKKMIFKFLAIFPEQQVKYYLENLSINFKLHAHPAVYTCEEAKNLCGDIPGVHSKNLLLKGKKTNSFFLAILPEYKKLDLKLLKAKFKEDFTFANDKELEEKLNIKTGAVSAFSLINNQNADITLLIDKDVIESQIVSFHPNINTETLELSQADFQKYLSSLKNKIEII